MEKTIKQDMSQVTKEGKYGTSTQCDTQYVLAVNKEKILGGGKIIVAL